MKHAVILSITSDIGFDLACRLSEDGYAITGTYRSKEGFKRVSMALPTASLIECDLSDKKSVTEAMLAINKLMQWDLFISCPCEPLPLKSFYESNIDEWQTSFELNSLTQLKFLHGIYSSIRRDTVPTVMFFAGGGSNNAVENFSAYTSAKIHLTKMIELLAHEDQSVRYLILGPGWTDTKTHQITLANTLIGSKKYNEVNAFIKNPVQGTPFIDIYKCLQWLMTLAPNVVSGRNFSVVHDFWREDFQNLLAEILANEPNFYKLRRFGNDRLPSYSLFKNKSDLQESLGKEINLLRSYPKNERSIEHRFRSNSNGDGDVEISDYGNLANNILFDQLLEKQSQIFNEKYFDGSREEGYGGYEYDRKYWFEVARDLINFYKLKPGDTILELGCAKGFLLHDLQTLLPGLIIRGIDISNYAIENAMPQVRSCISLGDAASLDYPDKSIDLVLAINTLSELPINKCKRAIREISRVSRGKSFITLNSWRNDEEKEQLLKWNLTAPSNFSVDEWRNLLREEGYRGDFYWFFAT
jgi:NADP-dependent 3-hydroxy acid dehydrogenase YdfG/SAM-dependent methyltransferase